MVDLFFSRLQVKIADRARELSDLASLHKKTEEVQRCDMATADWRDVSASSFKSIDQAFDGTSGLAASGYLLAAFWDYYQIQFQTAVSRLLVNPPSNLKLEGPVMTLSTQAWLSGSYGKKFSQLPLDQLDFINFESTFYGFFDEVVIFWDHGLYAKALVTHLIAGSTVTLVRPRSAKHGFWTGWAGLDLSFSGVLDVLRGHFKLQQLNNSVQAENFESFTYGLEAK